MDWLTRTMMTDDWRDLPTFTFGDGPALAETLLTLVIEGRKTATCWAAREGLKGTQVGKRMVALDSRNRPRVVLETVNFVQNRFCDVDSDFARREGEGDLTLAWWREAHRRYFARNGGFAPDMMLWYETFRVIEILALDGS